MIIFNSVISYNDRMNKMRKTVEDKQRQMTDFVFKI